MPMPLNGPWKLSPGSNLYINVVVAALALGFSCYALIEPSSKPYQHELGAAGLAMSIYMWVVVVYIYRWSVSADGAGNVLMKDVFAGRVVTLPADEVSITRITKRHLAFRYRRKVWILSLLDIRQKALAYDLAKRVERLDGGVAALITFYAKALIT
jgi:hypothetical protein